MVKDVNITNKKDKIKTKVERKFEKADIEVSDASFLARYYLEGVYDYEIWGLTTVDNVTYQNIYSMEDGKRELVQTIGSTSGLSIELNNPGLHILSDGEIRFMTVNIPEGEDQPVVVSIYDVNYKLKNSNTIQRAVFNESITNPKTLTSIGDNLIFQ